MSLTLTSVLSQSIIPITPTTTSSKLYSSSIAPDTRDNQSVLMLFSSTPIDTTTILNDPLSTNRESSISLGILTSYVINLSTSPSTILHTTTVKDSCYSALRTFDRVSSSALPTGTPISSPESRVVKSSSNTQILKSSCFAESPRVYQTLLGSSKSIVTSFTSTHQTMIHNTAISPTSVAGVPSLITTIPRDTLLSTVLLVKSLSFSPTPTVNVTSLSNVLIITSTLSPISRTFSSSNIEIMETVSLPSPSSPTEGTNQVRMRTIKLLCRQSFP